MLRLHVTALIYQSFSLIMAEPLRGNDILPAKIPFIASLAFKLPDGKADRAHFCTGSLIAKNLVLTAAHCLKDKKYDHVDVVIGAADLRGAKPKYEVESWKTFDRWAAKRKPMKIGHRNNDIAVVKLKREVEQPGVIPANITSLRNTELYETNATMIGWTAERGRGISRFLKKAKVQILEPTECEQRYSLITNQLARVYEGLLCTAANPFAIVTSGDSGSPLLDEKNNILGITRSFCPLDLYDNCDEDFADEHRFNLHTDFIDEYRQFIDDSKVHF